MIAILHKQSLQISGQVFTNQTMNRITAQLPIIAHGVSMICRIEDRFLLVERGKDPLKGSLAFPGGGVETCETAEQAAHRELKEETGLNCAELRLIETIDLSKEGLYVATYNLSIFRANGITGTPQAGDDAVALYWLTVQEMLNYPVTLSTLAFARLIVQQEL